MKRDKYQALARELKEKLWKMKLTMIPIVIVATETIPKRIGKGNGKLGNKRTSGDHPDYSFIKIGQNTEKRPGDLRRLAVAQTPLKDHQLALVLKTLKGIKYRI